MLRALLGTVFGLYFYPKRPQDRSVDAMIRIIGHYGAAVAVFEIGKAAMRGMDGEEAAKGVGLVEKAFGDFTDTDCPSNGDLLCVVDTKRRSIRRLLRMIGQQFGRSARSPSLVALWKRPFRFSSSCCESSDQSEGGGRCRDAWPGILFRIERFAEPTRKKTYILSLGHPSNESFTAQVPLSRPLRSSHCSAWISGLISGAAGRSSRCQRQQACKIGFRRH
jgi:hypothetical protein